MFQALFHWWNDLQDGPHAAGLLLIVSSPVLFVFRFIAINHSGCWEALLSPYFEANTED